MGRWIRSVAKETEGFLPPPEPLRLLAKGSHPPPHSPSGEQGGDFVTLPIRHPVRYPPDVTRPQAETWSIARSLAFLAATFAIVFGSLLPFAAYAASTPGHPMVICSAEGPQTISIGVDGQQDPNKGMSGVKCSACVMAVVADLPTPPALQPARTDTTYPASRFVTRSQAVPPPARAPPRPPSTAPPQA